MSNVTNYLDHIKNTVETLHSEKYYGSFIVELKFIGGGIVNTIFDVKQSIKLDEYGKRIVGNKS